jgi:phage terminase small subunit
MPRGGSRPGAGRKADPNSGRQQAAAKRAAPAKAIAPSGEKDARAPASWPFGTAQEKEPELLSSLTPLDYLLSLVQNPKEDKRIRIQAATIAAPYVHPKKGEGTGKKEQQAAAAKQVASRFSTGAPPKLVAAGGKKV